MGAKRSVMLGIAGLAVAVVFLITLDQSITLMATIIVSPLALIAVLDDRAVPLSVIRRTQGHCPQCDYELRFNFKHGCPECGWRRSR